MISMKKANILCLVLGLLASHASAGDAITYQVDDQSYDDVLFGLENAIIDAGLVVSDQNHVGEMLERTKADVGATSTVYVHADVFGFCSAELSRAAMEADPMNIRFCPYRIFTYQVTDDSPVVIGFDSLPNNSVMQDVQSLLDRLARAAIGIE
jgi:uncharacterized protein (DUF302 family)